MMRVLKKSLLLLFLLNLFFIPLKAKAIETIYFSDDSLNKSKCDLKMNERKLWIDHVLWTRNYIIADIDSLEDKEAVLERLLKNQDDIGNSIKPYYGEEAGNKLSSLLREHIKLAGQVLDASKSGNKNDFEKYNKLWYQNVDEIADFLSSANPKYSNKILKSILHKHLDLILEAVNARLNKDWKADIDAYDRGEDHMINFADVLTDGIIKQFPEKFK